MPEETAILLLTSDPAKEILEQVAKNRFIRFGELLAKIKPSFDRGEAKRAVGQLKQLNLIDERESAIDDFNTLFITADGLAASRRLA